MSTNLENRLNNKFDINYNEVCRVCLAQSPSLFEIFTIIKPYTDGISIPEKIVACASIQVSCYIQIMAPRSLTNKRDKIETHESYSLFTF